MIETMIFFRLIQDNLKKFQIFINSTKHFMFVSIFLIIITNQLSTCEAVQLDDNFNRKQDNVQGTGPDSNLGRLYVGEVVSDSITSATGHDAVGQATYDNQARISVNTDEKLPYDIITFSGKNNLDGIPRNEFHDANQKSNNIIGTVNLIKYVNDQVELDSKTHQHDLKSNRNVNDINPQKVQRSLNNVFNNNPSEFSWFPRDGMLQVQDDNLKYNWYKSNLNNNRNNNNHKNYDQSFVVKSSGIDKRFDVNNKNKEIEYPLKSNVKYVTSPDDKTFGGNRKSYDGKEDDENGTESEQNDDGSSENEYDNFGETPHDQKIDTPSRTELFEGEEDAPLPPKDEDEERVRNFVSDHEHPRDVPTRLNYPGGGLWARPEPESGIKLDFVPRQIYTQTRHTSSVKYLPQEEAFAEASTPEEIVNAPRLREVVSHKKTQEVYEEEGYEDTAYDHGGYKKHSKDFEKIHKNALAYTPEDDVTNVRDASTALKDHETYLPQQSRVNDYESQGSGQKQVVQATTPYGTPKLRKWKSQKTTSNEKSVTLLNNNGKSDIRLDKPTPRREEVLGRSIVYTKLKNDAPSRVTQSVKEPIDDALTQQSSQHSQHKSSSRSPFKYSTRPEIISRQAQPAKATLRNTLKGTSHVPSRTTDLGNPELSSKNSERVLGRQNAYSRRRQNDKSEDYNQMLKNTKDLPIDQDEKDVLVTAKLKQLQKQYQSSKSDSADVEHQEDDIKIDPNHPSSFYSGAFIYNKPRMIKLKKSGLPVDESTITDYDDSTYKSGSSNDERTRQGSIIRNNANKYAGRSNQRSQQTSSHRGNQYDRRGYQNGVHLNQSPRDQEEEVGYHVSDTQSKSYKPTSTLLTTNSGRSSGILTQWSTPLLFNQGIQNAHLSKTPNVQQRTVSSTLPQNTNTFGLVSTNQQFPSWNGQLSLFEPLPERIDTRPQKEAESTRSEVIYNGTPNLEPDWIPIHPEQIKTSKPHTQDSNISPSELITKRETLSKQESVSNNEKPSSEKIIEQLTLAHYSNPSNINVYSAGSASKLRRMISLAEELNRPSHQITNSDEDDDKIDSSLNNERRKRSLDRAEGRLDYKNRNEKQEDEKRRLDSERNYNSYLPRNVELVNFQSDGTTTEIPVDVIKYPFYKYAHSEGFEKYSPLRYATNPKFIPKKSGKGMEFYESRDHIECEEPSPPKDVVPERMEDGEWNERPVPDLPRIKGLGDKIQCLRTKFFGKDPLDNPFFKEESVSVPEVFASDRKSDIEDQLGLYVDIMSNIKSNSDLQTDIPHIRRPTRNITLNDRFKGYGKKYTNGYKPYYGKFNKYSSTYSKDNFKQTLNNIREDNQFNQNQMKILTDAHTSSSNNLHQNGNNNKNSLNQINNNMINNENVENFDSFIPSYLPVRDDTVAINNYKNIYNNACKHYEYLLKPLMSMTPPSPMSEHIYDDQRRKPIRPKLYPSSIYSLLNSADKKPVGQYGNRYVRGSRFNTRQPLRFSYTVNRPHNADKAGSGSIYHTKIDIKAIDDMSHSESHNRPKIILNGVPLKQMRQQYYTIIRRPKRQTYGKRPIFYIDMRRNEPRYTIIKHRRHKRNLNFDEMSKPADDTPIAVDSNKYHKIISRDDRNATKSSEDQQTDKPAVRYLTQELTLILNVHDVDENSTKTENERTQRKADISITNTTLLTTDTMYSGSDKIEKEHVTENTELNKNTEEESKGTTGQVSRLSGGFISRHSPVYSSKYKKNSTVEPNVSTTSEQPTTESETEVSTSKQTSEEVNLSTTSMDTLTTVSSRLKVRFPKLTAKPTVAIVPEDHTKTIKPKTSARQTQKPPTTSTTMSTTTSMPLTTTRMYKPKRVYKKENTHKGRIVDAFAVLNRQRDGSSERHSNQNFGTTTLSYDSIYQEPPSEAPDIENIDSTTRRTFRFKTITPRNYQVEHRRITKEEIIKQTYHSNEDIQNNPQLATKEVATLFDHPDLRDPTARLGKNGEEQTKEELGASSNKDERVMSETIMYVVDPVTGFGHWESEPRLTKPDSKGQRNQNSIVKGTANDNPRQRSNRYDNRSKSRYQDNEKTNKKETTSVTSRSNRYTQQIAATDVPSVQRDSNSVNERANNRRQRGRSFRNKNPETINVEVPSMESEVVAVRNLFSQVPPYVTATPYFDEEVDEDDVGDGIVVGDKVSESSTPKIIVEPDKRMYYYLPE